MDVRGAAKTYYLAWEHGDLIRLTDIAMHRIKEIMTGIS